MTDNTASKLCIQAWIIDMAIQMVCELGELPHIIVNTEGQLRIVEVPKEYVKKGAIVLNISSAAVHNFHLDKVEGILTFNSRFNGKSRAIKIPVEAIIEVSGTPGSKSGFAIRGALHAALTSRSAMYIHENGQISANAPFTAAGITMPMIPPLTLEQFGTYLKQEYGELVAGLLGVGKEDLDGLKVFKGLIIMETIRKVSVDRAPETAYVLIGALSETQQHVGFLEHPTYISPVELTEEVAADMRSRFRFPTADEIPKDPPHDPAPLSSPSPGSYNPEDSAGPKKRGHLTVIK